MTGTLSRTDPTEALEHGHGWARSPHRDQVPAPRVGFVLLSRLAAPMPSTRVSVGNILTDLECMGFEVEIAFEPEEPTEQPNLSECMSRIRAAGYDVVYFQKVHGPSVLALVQALRADGVKCVYGVCDLVNEEMVAACDATTVVTEYLKGLYPVALQSRIRVVHDGIERPDIFKTEHRPDRGSWRRPLRAVLVTSTAPWRLRGLRALPSWLSLEVVGAFPPASAWLQRGRQHFRELRLHASAGERLELLRWLANRRISCVKWEPDDVYRRLLSADIGVIPIDTSSEQGPAAAWRVKSENRLTLMMALGLPVIATPIPAYEAIVNQGHNGFLARSHDQWLSTLELLRDADVRRCCGEAARNDVIQAFSTQRQASLLAEVLGSFRD